MLYRRVMDERATKSATPIYLDGYATTQLAPEVHAAMAEAWSRPGNAGSPHLLGEVAAAAVDRSRAAVAHLLGAAPSEIVFTSGATESNNLAIIGVARWALASGKHRRRIVISAVEHKAVLESANSLASLGFEVIVAPVTTNGIVDIAALGKVVDEKTLMVSVMAANNETGVLQPVAEVGAIARSAGALFHCDAAQAAGKVPLDVVALDVDYLSISGHKFYGPMGIGALYTSAAAPTPLPIQFGGGQQGGVRPGTEPVPLIVGIGAAANLAHDRIGQDAAHGRRLADRMRMRLEQHQVAFDMVTDGAPVLPGSLSLKITDVDADEIVVSLARTVCISTGSACTSGQMMPSHVLLAMGLMQEQAKSVIRIFCGRYNSVEQIDLASTLIAETCLKLRHRTGRVHQ
ncbi:cysteine desulfurase family protein [Inquilinus sp. YAF38]|uniref:cysteine desulfurase family protein n=1 Tax=Inquilinus sp. YAF38 TaxID=3233084 RepID=UPI003F91299F